MSLDAELIINLLPVYFFPEYFSITPHDPWTSLCKSPNSDLISVQLACTCNFSIFYFDYGINQRLFHLFPPQIDTEFSVHIYIVPLHLI